MPFERNIHVAEERACMHRAPNWSALRTPFQFLTGCGGFQRRSPTGGAANGMPR